jgi:hypothetical protein
MAVGAAFRANSHDDQRRIRALLDGSAIILRKNRAIEKSGATH